MQIRSSVPVRETAALALASAVALALTTSSAAAHCLIGKRFFPAGLAVEDPCAADELSLLFTHIKEPGEEEDPARKRTSFEFEFSKRITEDFAVSVGTAYNIFKARGEERRTGWDNIEVGFRYQFLTLPKPEFVASAGLAIEFGRTGTSGIGAERVTVFTPTLFLGKGMGDLPDSMALLRPLAFTGTIGWAIPQYRTSLTSATDEDTGEVTFSRVVNPKVLHWNFSVQYSIPYLQSNVRNVGLEAPFNRLVPVVEFDFEMATNGPDRNRVTGKVLPGLLWTSRYGQIGAAAIIPINSRTGQNIGAIAQLHFYLDDIAPGVFAKPLFRTRP